MVTTRHIFTSHYKGDTERVKRLEGRLNENQSGYNFKSSTIDETKIIQSSNEKTIRNNLRSRIGFASTLIVAIGPHTHAREWVDWEIQEAARSGKNILGVFLHGESDSKLPKALEKYGNALLGYNNIERIIDCIEGESDWDPNRSSKIKMPDEIERSAC